MPIEIKELHIRVAVNTSTGKQSSATHNTSGGSGTEGDKDAIVAECVEQVLQVLKTKGER